MDKRRNDEKLNILLTSVGRRSYLVEYFKEALSGKGMVHVANSDEKSPAFQMADKSVVTPLIYDESYISFLVSYCKENNISAIISLFDVDLPILAKNKEVFDQMGVRLVISKHEVVDICNDKWKTYCYLREKGFRQPVSFCVLKDAIEALFDGKMHFPLILKPRWGMGSIGIIEVTGMEELRVFYGYVKREIENTYLKYESGMDIEKCIIMQEKIGGQEYGLDIINDLNGQYITTIVKKKCAMRSGETDCAITVDNVELKSIGSKLGKSLGHIANLDVDVFLTDEDVPIILEMNARFGGGYPFSHMAGVNLPEAIVKWLRNEPVDDSILKEEYGIMAQKDIRLVCLLNQ